MRRCILRILSIILIQTFLLSDLGYALPSDNRLRSNAASKKEHLLTTDQILIPKELGEVRSKFTGKNSKIVIHIQDAHCNYEAQINISKLIRYLALNYNVRLISAEGAERYIDTSWFRKSGDKATVAAVADRFVKMGEFTGVELAAIKAEEPLTLFGAEDRKRYFANLEVFLRAYPLRGEAISYLLEMKDALQSLKNKIYNKDLLVLDEKADSCASKPLSFNKYIMFLAGAAKSLGVDMRSFAEVEVFIEVLELEKKIDFKAAETEKAELANSVSMGIKINAGDHPNLAKYMEYIRLYSGIDHPRLFSSVKTLENAVREKLIKDPAERECEKLSRSVNTLIALVSLDLDKSAREYYMAHKTEFDLNAMSRALIRLSGVHGAEPASAARLAAAEKAIAGFDEFYAVAASRDADLAGNTLRAMDNDRFEAAILVTGGFHSEGMERFFKEKDVSYLVVCPRISRMTSTNYLEVLAGYRVFGDKFNIAPDENTSGLAPVLRTYVAQGGIGLEGAGLVKEEWNRGCEDSSCRAKVCRSTFGIRRDSKYYSSVPVKWGKTIIIANDNSQERPGITIQQLGQELIDKKDASGRAVARKYTINFRGKDINIIIEKGITVGKKQTLSPNEMKAIISHAVDRVESMRIRQSKVILRDMPSTLVIAFLDKSPSFIEDHLDNGFIGLNRAMSEELKRRDARFRDIMVRVGIIHQLVHQVAVYYGDVFEKKVLDDDAEYANMLIRNLGVSRDSFAVSLSNVLERDSLMARIGEFADSGVVRTVTSFSPEWMERTSFDLAGQKKIANDLLDRAMVLEDRTYTNEEIAKIAGNIHPRYRNMVIDPYIFMQAYAARLDSAANERERQACFEALQSCFEFQDERKIGKGLYEIDFKLSRVILTVLRQIENYPDARSGPSRAGFVMRLAREYPWVFPMVFNEIASLKEKESMARTSSLEEKAQDLREARQNIEDSIKPVPVDSPRYRSNVLREVIAAVTYRPAIANIPAGLPVTKEDHESLLLRTVSYLGEAANISRNIRSIRNDPVRSYREMAMVMLWRSFEDEVNRTRSMFDKDYSHLPNDIRNEQYRISIQRLIIYYNDLIEMMLGGSRPGVRIGNIPEPIYDSSLSIEQRMSAAKSIMWLALFGNESALRVLRTADHELLRELSRDWTWRAQNIADEYDLRHEIELPEGVRRAIYDPRNDAEIYPSSNGSMSDIRFSSPDMAIWSASHVDRNLALAQMIKSEIVFRIAYSWDHQNQSGVSLEEYIPPEWIAPRSSFFSVIRSLLAGNRVKKLAFSRIKLLRDIDEDSIEHAAGSKLLDVSGIAKWLNMKEIDVRTDLARLARRVDILVVAGRFALHDGGPYAHARRGVSGRSPAIWLGEYLLNDTRFWDDDLALLLLEEAKHILAPDAPNDAVKHSPELLDKLMIRSIANGEKPYPGMCETDVIASKTTIQNRKTTLSGVESGRLLVLNAKGTSGTSKARIVFVKDILPKDILNAGLVNNLLNNYSKDYYEKMGYEIVVADNIEKANEALNEQGRSVRDTIICIDRENLRALKKIMPGLEERAKILAIERPASNSYVPVTEIFDIAAVMVRINESAAGDRMLRTQLENFLSGSAVEVIGDRAGFISSILSAEHKRDPFAFAEKYALKLPPVKPIDIQKLPDIYKATKEALSAA